jgi:4-amino-4-deoxy-L-arabinose transferase-like glycosyltransferase
MQPSTFTAAQHRKDISPRQALWLMVLVLLTATALRLVSSGDVPPGLYHDEAYNGLDALKVLEGDLSLYFSANNGREPMFIYLVALGVGVLGRSPLAVRLAAFVPGLLTVATTYALGRALFSRRIGLLAAAVLSVMLWHFHLSRVGFRAVLLPLFIALATWQAALAWRSGRRRQWLAAGALYGLGFYTYMAVRFTPLALALFGLYLVRTYPRQRLVPILWAGLGAVLILLPLVAFTLFHPDLVLSRTGQVAIWNQEIHQGDFWGTLIKHTLRTMGMFFVQGDRIWRHNVPWRPVFDPLLGLLFTIGVFRALRRFRQSGPMAFLLIWVGMMTLPTLLAEDAPHFLRGVGVLPFAAVFPALGLEWLGGASRSFFQNRFRIGRGVRFIVPVLLALILTFGLLNAGFAYFGEYAHAEMTAYWFESGAESLAGDINGFVGRGWSGDRMLHGASGEQRAYVEAMLWYAWTSLPFLVPESPAVQLLPSNGSWPEVDAGSLAFYVWPYGDWRRVWTAIDEPAEIRVKEGARSQGDRDPEPFTTYLAFYAEPAAAPSDVLARFQNDVDLVDVVVRSHAEGLTVELMWRAGASFADDYTVFAHYLRDGSRIAQSDTQPAGGFAPTSLWRVGDLIHDDHIIPLPEMADPARDSIRIGLYRATDGQHLALLDGSGNPSAQAFELSLGEVLP